jgi:tetratricopeptide (TPR) repeat protein
MQLRSIHRGGNALIRLAAGVLVWWCMGFPALAADTPRNTALQRAFRLYNAFEYEKALKALEKASQQPDLTDEEKVSIGLLEGVLSFETQQPERGRSAFARALELNLEANPPFALAPKVATVLEEERERIRLIRFPPTPVVIPPVTDPPTDVEISSNNPWGSKLRLPVAIGGGAVAVSGLVFWSRAKSLEGKVRRADRSITTSKQLDDTLQKGRTFETVGWVLMPLGVAASVGSLLLLDSRGPEVGVAVLPTSQGAQMSVSGSFP